MTMKATTRDLGFAIRDFIEGYDFHHYEEVADESGELQESEEAFEIANVDVSDPNNLNIRLDNGQTIVVRIFAGE